MLRGPAAAVNREESVPARERSGYSATMGLLLKPWFAVAVLVAAIGLWAFTVGPWGPWRYERTDVRLKLRGDTYKRQTSITPQFALNGGPATLKIAAAPPKSVLLPRKTLIADVHWQFIPLAPRASGNASGDEGLMSPDLATGPMELLDDHGASLRGRFRLAIGATGNAPMTITAAVTAERGYWYGIPVFWIILAAGLVYLGLNVILLRRQYPPNRPLARQRHEYE
jgi:hypothetical protein